MAFSGWLPGRVGRPTRAAAVWLYDDIYLQVRLFRAPLSAPSGNSGTLEADAVGWDSPPRDDITWLATRFSRLANPRWQQFGCVLVVSTRCACSKLQFLSLREIVAHERQEPYRGEPCRKDSPKHAQAYRGML